MQFSRANSDSCGGGVWKQVYPKVTIWQYPKVIIFDLSMVFMFELSYLQANNLRVLLKGYL